MAENTTLIDLHLEMFRGSIISTCIKFDSFIYGRALSLMGDAKLNAAAIAQLLNNPTRAVIKPMAAMAERAHII
jgi:hypothetical protein